MHQCWKIFEGNYSIFSGNTYFNLLLQCFIALLQWLPEMSVKTFKYFRINIVLCCHPSVRYSIDACEGSINPGVLLVVTSLLIKVASSVLMNYALRWKTFPAAACPQTPPPPFSLPEPICSSDMYECTGSRCCQSNPVTWPSPAVCFTASCLLTPEPLLCMSVHTQSCDLASPPLSPNWLIGCDGLTQWGGRVSGEPRLSCTSLDHDGAPPAHRRSFTFLHRMHKIIKPWAPRITLRLCLYNHFNSY